MPLPSSASTVSDTYGGPYDNQRQVQDATTEMDASLGNQELNDVAMMTAMTRKAWVEFSGVTYSGSGTDSIAVVAHSALWGSGTSVKPTIGEDSAGHYVITWPATTTDQLGATHTTNVLFPHRPQVIGDTTKEVRVLSWTANTITIQAYSSGSANALDGTTIFVEWS